MRNPDDRADEVDKFLSEAEAVEGRRQLLIADLLKQKEASIKAFDQKLARLGYQAGGVNTSKRSHHKNAASAGKLPKPSPKPSS